MAVSTQRQLSSLSTPPLRLIKPIAAADGALATTLIEFEVLGLVERFQDHEGITRFRVIEGVS